MNMTFSDFKGIPCVWLDNGHVRLAVTTQRGPRILFFGQTGGENLLAELPDFVVGKFHFLGGHRLWASPESLYHTYHPDDDPPLFLDIHRPGGRASAWPMNIQSAACT
jgi:hypothetical protein